MQALIAVIAALAGIAVGFLLRNASAKSEKALIEALNQKLSADAETLKTQLTEAQGRAQSASADRARFEATAEERQKTLDTLARERESLQADLQTHTATEKQSAARIRELETSLANEQKNMAEKVALLETAKTALANQFEALAGKILDEKSKTFADVSQKDLNNLLDPLKTQIKEFREKVEAAQKDSNTGVTKLETLIGSLSMLNVQLAEEAKNLTTALRGSTKTQGDWGEFILRDLLEKAGLREGEQYSFQQSFTAADSENSDRTRTVRTDVIVYLPGSRHLVIDSKVSLTAYTDCVSATDDLTRSAALRQHLASVRGHITGLGKAGYHRLSGVESPDFVVMFIPIEPAFLLALQNDENLWADAYRQGILLVGPTTLLYVIRIVHVLWQQELQAKSVQEVMDRGTALYEKFVGFVTDMESIGRGIRSADQSYSNAIKKLSEGPGNLVRQVEMLKKLGIRSTKSLPKNLLDAAEADEPSLALAASADDSTTQD
ncbi:DNA recombination protein RmuC [Terracidiphilus gabretensis]|uniref:DNA recombination protein RmuC n=1 Tax=Terracidiphilus gabretensis TaxID=1577687 RepID=UPI00071B4128|nr:DNA recombination protein RmuC [Terracidiphilus gabretensis]